MIIDQFADLGQRPTATHIVLVALNASTGDGLGIETDVWITLWAEPGPPVHSDDRPIVTAARWCRP